VGVTSCQLRSQQLVRRVLILSRSDSSSGELGSDTAVTQIKTGPPPYGPTVSQQRQGPLLGKMRVVKVAKGAATAQC